MTASVVVFDGECVLCSVWVGFLIERDPRGVFRFAAMQTPRGRKLLLSHGIDPNDPVTFLLLEDGRAFVSSDAVLRIVRRLGWGWRALAATLWMIPRPVRDALYRSVARHRYRWFGRRSQCYLPRPEDAGRFL